MPELEVGGFHRLYLDAPFFDAVSSYDAPFVVLPNDQNYQVGDLVEFLEWAPGRVNLVWNRVTDGPTDRICRRTVTYVLRHEDYPQGIMPGYCVLGLKERGYYQIP